MSQNYSLYFVNNSTNPGKACVYQTDPHIGVTNVMSLAWFSESANPSERIQFDWSIDYSFMWSETGVLASGVTFAASESWKIDSLSKNNKVTFTKKNGSYTFEKQGDGPSGSLTIEPDGTIPFNQASIGIGMSGQGTFAVQAQPNLNESFIPHPKYWITFGNYEAGEVLDLESITNPAEIAFPENVYSMTAILNHDNSWTVMQTSEVNALYLKAKALAPLARWGDLSGPKVGASKKAAALSR